MFFSAKFHGPLGHNNGAELIPLSRSQNPNHIVEQRGSHPSHCSQQRTFQKMDQEIGMSRRPGILLFRIFTQTSKITNHTVPKRQNFKQFGLFSNTKHFLCEPTEQELSTGSTRKFYWFSRIILWFFNFTEIRLFLGGFDQNISVYEDSSTVQYTIICLLLHHLNLYDIFFEASP